MLQTLERTNIFDARVLTAAHADALRALAGPGGLPLLPCLHPALEEGQIVGDYAGQDELQAAAALLPLYAEDPVSYTHLDVYKRQALGMETEPGLRYRLSVPNTSQAGMCVWPCSRMSPGCSGGRWAVLYTWPWVA